MGRVSRTPGALPSSSHSGCVTSLQPEELQQQAGAADSGADPGALGQPASQPDQHQAELYALQTRG